MVQFVYSSAALTPFSASDLNRLLAKSRGRNTLYQVTGILLFHSGSFLQVLEGPEAAIEATYSKILRDKRHGAAHILLQKTIERREFENWSMGFVDTSNSLSLPEGFVDYHRGLPQRSDASTRAAQYLRFFQQGLCREVAR